MQRLQKKMRMRQKIFWRGYYERTLKKAKAIIEGYDGPAVRVMEVCGTHTHEIFHLGVRKILPPQVELISGPGCPVCVTPQVLLMRQYGLLWRKM